MNITYQDYIGLFENAASEEYCKKIIDTFERLQSTNPSCVTNNSKIYGNELKRKDTAIFFEQHETDLCVETNQILDNCLQEYISEYPGLREQNFQSIHVKVQKTLPKGGYHLWHCEHGSGSSASRNLVWTIYLNDVPEGQGETEFFHQGLRLQPKQGTVCLFPASWTHTHRGNFTTTATKYIATGWYNLI